MSILENKMVLQIVNLIALILTILINVLANAIPIGGKNTGELSDALPNLFVPAGLTFSIWFVIYLLLTIFAIYQARDLISPEKQNMPFLYRISYIFLLSSIANIVWIFLWHYQQVLFSLFLMVVLFLSLLAIYLRLDIGRAEVPRNEKLFVHVPFSVYIGWITVATIANVTAFLVSINWDGFGIPEEIWTIIVIAVAVIITLAMLFTRKDIAYSLVVVWASIGIVIKQITGAILVATTAAIGAVIISIGIIVIATPIIYNWYKETSS
ncbi:MAG: hypothetical protein ACFFCZ_24645 [Promethearchaeota archaeon]